MSSVEPASGVTCATSASGAPGATNATSAPEERVAELQANLDAVRERIRSYSQEAASRAPSAAPSPAPSSLPEAAPSPEPSSLPGAAQGSAPKLIVVTKFFPASDVRALVSMGVGDVGENKEQEASAKHAELSDLSALRWHFIGQLQRNKAKSIAKFAHSVHSLDRENLAHALSRAVVAENVQRVEAGLPPRADLECFVQLDLRELSLRDVDSSDVDLRELNLRDVDRHEHAPVAAAAGTSAAGTRGGVAPDQLLSLANTLSELPGLRLAGVMAVAPLGADPYRAFERLRSLSQEVQREHPGATGISAGMSQDMQAAIENGATHLRIGSDILGSRPPVR